MTTLGWGVGYGILSLVIMYFLTIVADGLCSVSWIHRPLQVVGKFTARHHMEHFVNFVLTTTVWLSLPYLFGAVGACVAAGLYRGISIRARAAMNNPNQTVYTRDCIWFNAIASKSHLLISLVYLGLHFLDRQA